MARELTLEHPLLSGEQAEAILPAVEGERAGRAGLGGLDRRQTLGGVLILAGLLAVLGAWFGISGTNNTTDQLSYLASGGIGGAAFLLIGSILFVSQEHSRDRESFALLDARIRRLEEGLAAEFDHLYGLLGSTTPAEAKRR
ncbi:MAG TPA: hypothetical protein VHL53_21290 [Acidimicrobiia bacterium]|nr:hypothetical protein [Acidimicrobiia bacterium]